MQIAISDQDVDEFIGIINQIAQEHPILVDKYIMGKEIEVDAICDGTDILIPGIMRISREPVSIPETVSPSIRPDLTEKNIETLVDYTEKLARALHVKGMINIQFIVDGDDVYIIEVNPRSSRTVPYISKVTGIPIVPLATQIICGRTIGNWAIRRDFSLPRTISPSRCRYSPSRKSAAPISASGRR